MDTLPDELIDNIAISLRRIHHYNWLRTSKRYCRILTPYLYNHIEVEWQFHTKERTDMNTLTLTNALTNTPALLNMVKKYNLDYRDSKATKNMHDVILSAPNLETICVYNIHDSAPKNPPCMIYETILLRKYSEVQQSMDFSWILPGRHDFTSLKELVLGYCSPPLSMLGNVFRLPSLEILRIHGVFCLDGDEYKINLRAWEYVISPIKHLYIYGLYYDREKEFSGDLGSDLRQISKSCPRLETFVISGFNNTNRCWNPLQLMPIFRNQPLRKLGIQQTCSDQLWYRTYRQPSIHEELLRYDLEELYIDWFLCRDALSQDDILLPSTLQGIRIYCGRQNTLGDDAVAFLQKTTVETIKKKLPALRQIFIQCDIHMRLPEPTWQELRTTYEAVGISMTSIWWPHDWKYPGKPFSRGREY